MRLLLLATLLSLAYAHWPSRHQTIHYTQGLDMLQTLYEFPIVTTNVSESTRLIE